MLMGVKTAGMIVDAVDVVDVDGCGGFFEDWAVEGVEELAVDGW